MNIIDLGILSIVFISILIGMYYGFTVSLFNIASFMISWLFSFLFYPLFTKGIMKRFPDLIEKVIYYSEGSSKILFADKTLPVSTLSGSEITRIVNSSGLPNPFNHNIHSNLTNQSLGGLSNVGQYFDHTVANIIINLGSFILLFLILQLIFVVAISLTKNLIDLPLLRRMDNITAGVLGLVRGFLFLFIIFAFVPLLYVVAPAAFIEQFIRGSKFINFFLDANFFTSVIKGVI